VSASIAQGDYASAEEISDRTLAILMELGNTALTAVHLGNMADLLCQRGKLDLAAARGEAGLLLAHQVGNGEATLESLVILGQIAVLRGDLTAAEQRFRAAEQALPSPDDPRMSAWVDWQKGELLRAQGRPTEAEQLHRQALTKREQYHLEGFAAESQVSLAMLALDRAQPAQAEALVKQALERFQVSKNQDSAAWAQALLSQALALQGRTADSRAAFLPALTRLAKSENVSTRLSGLIALGGTAVKSTLPAPLLAELRQQLRAGIDLANRAGMLPVEVELSSYLYLLESPAGITLVRPERLCELSRRAAEKGLMRVAASASVLCRTE